MSVAEDTARFSNLLSTLRQLIKPPLPPLPCAVNTGAGIGADTAAGTGPSTVLPCGSNAKLMGPAWLVALAVKVVLFLECLRAWNMGLPAREATGSIIDVGPGKVVGSWFVWL